MVQMVVDGIEEAFAQQASVSSGRGSPIPSALTCNPGGKQNVGRSCCSMSWELEADIEMMISKWKQLGRIAKERVGWRMLLGGLCSLTGGSRRM
ncbi:unnamed protein product [Schistosoma curassoni]|uniref:Uncharacterized protein n=1 Tax=Schistosoma curassoni TaxID=6186 RepID=A0A183JEY1_9TREM|nr:unnamed protein product [Schistosoma curassoni]